MRSGASIFLATGLRRVVFRLSEQGTVLAFPPRLPVRERQIPDSKQVVFPAEQLVPGTDAANRPASVFWEVAWALVIPVVMMLGLRIAFICFIAL